MISYQNFPKLYVSLSELIWATNGSWILSFLYSGTISWDFQLNNSPTESQLTIFLYPKFKIYDMIMVSLRIIKYCYDSPMENEIETVWSQNNIIFKASPPIQTHFLNQNLWEWENIRSWHPDYGLGLFGRRILDKNFWVGMSQWI